MTDKGCCGSITKEFTVWCYECSEWNQYAEGGRCSVAKRYWKKWGWKIIKKVWYCPDCVKKLTEAKP